MVSTWMGDLFSWNSPAKQHYCNSLCPLTAYYPLLILSLKWSQSVPELLLSIPAKHFFLFFFHHCIPSSNSITMIKKDSLTKGLLIIKLVSQSVKTGLLSETSFLASCVASRWSPPPSSLTSSLLCSPFSSSLSSSLSLQASQHCPRASFHLSAL